MAVTLMNPTNEILEYGYAGVLYTFQTYPEQGSIKRVEENAGKHLKHHLGNRGLVELEYVSPEDNPDYEKKMVENGRKINRMFKERQIEKFNQSNQMRQDNKKPYAEPTKHLLEYAEELGVGLMRPFVVSDGKNEEIAKLKQEKEFMQKEYDAKLSALEKQNQQILVALENLGQPQKTVEETEQENEESNERALMRRYSNMNKGKYYEWLVREEGKEFYMTAPIKVQENMRQKFDNFYDVDPEKKFPY